MLCNNTLCQEANETVYSELKVAQSPGVLLEDRFLSIQLSFIEISVSWGAIENVFIHCSAVRLAIDVLLST